MGGEASALGMLTHVIVDEVRKKRSKGRPFDTLEISTHLVSHKEFFIGICSPRQTKRSSRP